MDHTVRMRWSLIWIGVALVVVGAVWIFQGIGVLKGSFMTGDASWSWIGAACVLIGLAILSRGLRRSSP